MEKIIKIEELSMLVLSIYLFNQTEFVWWMFLALILVPDVGMLGYIVSKKIGAIIYNLFHHKAIAILILCFGWYFSNKWVELSGIILFGHSSMDRVFGYGLKYFDSFKHTHLGWLKHGKDKSL